jgi:hypothetical protein
MGRRAHGSRCRHALTAALVALCVAASGSSERLIKSAAYSDRTNAELEPHSPARWGSTAAPTPEGTPREHQPWRLLQRISDYYNSRVWSRSTLSADHASHSRRVRCLQASRLHICSANLFLQALGSSLAAAAGRHARLPPRLHQARQLQRGGGPLRVPLWAAGRGVRAAGVPSLQAGQHDPGAGGGGQRQPSCHVC